MRNGAFDGPRLEAIVSGLNGAPDPGLAPLPILRWLVAPDAAALAAQGFQVVSWSWLRGGWIEHADGVGMDRKSLDSPAREWFDYLRTLDRVAVLGVCPADGKDLARVYGYLVEPALRFGLEVVVGAQRPLSDLDDAAFVEPDLLYAQSLERLRWLEGRVYPFPAADEAGAADVAPELDASQRAAVTAGPGVHQIIAPAGSGKTTVLVERVRELRRRGVLPECILAVTFNASAAAELKTRFAEAGVGDVMARTFHSLGRHILVESKLVPPAADIRAGPSQRQWRWLSARAMRAVGRDGKWIRPREAKRDLSEIKLGRLLFAEEYAATAGGACDGRIRSLVELYKLYEQLQGGDAERPAFAQAPTLFDVDEGSDAGPRSGRHSWLDFDDLILRAVRALRADPELRARWQSRWQQVLVDEYQDIEPAQETLVRMVAAPHDQLFCVGDEDQTLYAFRRASVGRIIGLDQHYPALERVSLRINYRCPPEVVAASRRLIEHNAIRFDKPIEPVASREGEPIEACRAHPRTPALVAQTLASRRRGEIVVLARTKLALRPIALACASEGVRIDGPPELFDESGHARGALRDHLRLVLFPERADAQLVRSICKTPGHWVGAGDEAQVVGRLREGAGFKQAFEGIRAPRHERGLLTPGELFDSLANVEDAGEAIRLLRGPGGLDSWFEEASGLDEIDSFDVDALEQAQREATGRTLEQCLTRLEGEIKDLLSLRDKDDGIELTTIHRAKGCQWPHVILVGCDDDVMPHRRAKDATPAQRAKGEGIEAERRLAYVALTRTTGRLEVYYDKDRRSQFLDEAGILSAAAPAARPGAAPPQPPPVSSAPR